MNAPSIFAAMFVAIAPLAAETSDFTQGVVSEGAVELKSSMISIPLAHKARSALLFYENSRKERQFCELRPDQASDFAGAEYAEIEGFTPILVKWAFLEPVDQEGLKLVVSHRPRVSVKGGVLYVSSSGIDIGDVGKVTDGALIIQVPTIPEDIVFKLSKTGW